MAVLRGSLFCALCFSAACSLDPAVSGSSCTRSTQCKPGLACVFPTGDGKAAEGRCSADLSSLYDPSQVPMLTPDAGPAVVPPVDAGTLAPDASALPPDASALPPDPGTLPPDPGMLPPDAGALPPDPGALPPDAG